MKQKTNEENFDWANWLNEEIKKRQQTLKESVKELEDLAQKTALAKAKFNLSTESLEALRKVQIIWENSQS